MFAKKYREYSTFENICLKDPLKENFENIYLPERPSFNLFEKYMEQSFFENIYLPEHGTIDF